MVLAAAVVSFLSPAATVGVRARHGAEEQKVSPFAVPAIPPKDAAAALTKHGSGRYLLLDVRPPWEREKAWVRGSLHVPVYVEDTGADPITLLKKWVHFGYVGLWTGQRFTTINPGFVSEVEKVVPSKEEKLLVACGEGLRSTVAVRKLIGGGYRNLALLAGGFNRAKEEDFTEVEGESKLRYATVGGVSWFFLQLLLVLRAVV
ncbi:hypothetical protein HPP92_013444 [Vanilla planifolia]|uniref:Rhodanese domain-containing protein n=1 Tax=Vanilla planifolia TaxID=51239 RepID=A0A835QVL3_VANPL|nr:hypothetical protein HPP92_013886 [Vanilla planifolia]KAG0478725.1 hypothetical protein HPP92_013444 [Vanilla planifolia]